MNANILQKTIQLLSFHEVSEIKLLVGGEEIVIKKSLRVCNDCESNTKWSNAVLYTDNRTISDQISKVWKNYATNDNWPVNEKEILQDNTSERIINSDIRLSTNDLDSRGARGVGPPKVVTYSGETRVGAAFGRDTNKYKTKMCRHYISYNEDDTEVNLSPSWVKLDSCPYKDRCNYAHGEEELRCIYGHGCKNKDNGCKRIHK
jgi:hypothetical protein